MGGHHKKVEITEIQLFLGIGVIISTTTYVETQSDTKKFLRKPHTGWGGGACQYQGMLRFAVVYLEMSSSEPWSGLLKNETNTAWSLG